MKRKLTKSVALGVVILAMAACTGKTSNSETTVAVIVYVNPS